MSDLGKQVLDTFKQRLKSLAREFMEHITILSPRLNYQFPES